MPASHCSSAVSYGTRPRLAKALSRHVLDDVGALAGLTMPSRRASRSSAPGARSARCAARRLRFSALQLGHLGALAPGLAVGLRPTCSAGPM